MTVGGAAKSTFFVSYCVDDVPEEFLDYLFWLLEKFSPDKVQPLVFSRLRIGEDVAAFMRTLDTEAAVLILLSPGYRQRVVDRKGGVYKEYSIIIDRFRKSEQARKGGLDPSGNPGYLEVYPLLYSGEPSSAVPPELSHLRWRDVRTLRVQRNDRNRFLVSRHNKTNYYPLLRELGERIRHACSVKSGEVLRASHELFELFFVDTKAGWRHLSAEQSRYLDTVFVRTFAYRKLDTQSAIFLIGRKGSGKSTMTDIMAIRNALRYKGVIAITGEELNLEAAFALFDPQQIRSDIRVLFGRREAFRYGWEVFLRICCMETLVLLQGTGHLTKYQAEHVPPIKEWLETLCRRTLTEPEPRNTYFTYSFSALTAFVQRCIDEARPDEKLFMSDVQSSFTRSKFRDYAIPQEVQQATSAIIESCRRHFLISLDAFDRAFDLFRKASDSRRSPTDARDRSLFEVEWLSAFLAEVLEINSNASHDPLYRLVEFCITIPQDRFFEVMSEERDSYRYSSKFRWLNWSGIELAILLRKRLEEYTGFATKKYAGALGVQQESPQKRLEEIHRAKFRHIPWEITFEFNGQRYKMPLFIYVLRHTFWRPRDMLFYYSRVLGTGEEMKRRGFAVSVDALRRTVQDATYVVINREYLQEFGSVLENIRDVVGAFRERRQVLTYSEVDELLREVKFTFASPTVAASSTEDKVAFLYETGFLGVYATADIRERLNVGSPHAFFFNEGAAPLRAVRTGATDRPRLIVHPVFSGYLGLDTSSNELILNPDWSYLRELEASLFESGDGFLL